MLVKTPAPRLERIALRLNRIDWMLTGKPSEADIELREIRGRLEAAILDELPDGAEFCFIGESMKTGRPAIMLCTRWPLRVSITDAPTVRHVLNEVA